MQYHKLDQLHLALLLTKEIENDDMKLCTFYLTCLFCITLPTVEAQITDLGVAVFDQANFEGRHTFFSEDREHATSFGIESIRIPPGWTVTVFTEISFQGQEIVLEESCNLDADLKNEIKSIRIDQKIGIDARYSYWDLKKAAVVGCVTLCGSSDFKLQRFRIKGNWILDNFHTVRSVHVPEGWEIWLYQNTLFEGPYLVLNTSWDGNGPERKEWRDNIKSIRVVRKPVHPPLPISNFSAGSLQSTGNVVLFEDTDFRGQSICIQQDWNSEIPIGIESIRIPFGWEVWLYEDKNFQGAYKRLLQSWNGGNDPDNDLWRNNIGSIRTVRKSSIPTALYISPQIEVFENANYQGLPYVVSGNWSCQTSGNQSWDNRISSIRVPPGVRVVVFENPNFSGKSYTITSSTTLIDFWNNQIGSIQVFRAD